MQGGGGGGGGGWVSPSLCKIFSHVSQFPPPTGKSLLFHHLSPPWLPTPFMPGSVPRVPPTKLSVCQYLYATLSTVLHFYSAVQIWKSHWFCHQLPFADWPWLHTVFHALRPKSIKYFLAVMHEKLCARSESRLSIDSKCLCSQSDCEFVNSQPTHPCFLWAIPASLTIRSVVNVGL